MIVESNCFFPSELRILEPASSPLQERRFKNLIDVFELGNRHPAAVETGDRSFLMSITSFGLWSDRIMVALLRNGGLVIPEGRIIPSRVKPGDNGLPGCSPII